MFTAKSNLSLPKLPEHLREEILKTYNILKDTDSVVTVATTNEIDGIYKVWFAPPSVDSWIKENICSNINESYVTGIQVVIGGLLPHIDPRAQFITENKTTFQCRYWTLMYLIQAGGPVTTNFFEPINNLPIRTERGSRFGPFVTSLNWSI